MKIGFFLKAQKFIVKNAPTILTFMGAVGTLAAVALSSDSALKAKKVIAAEEFKKLNTDICDKYLPEGSSNLYTETDIVNTIKENGATKEELTSIVRYDGTNSKLSKADRALIYIKCYVPTAIMTAASIFCMFGSNYINKQRIAALAGAYILKSTAFDEYKDKVKGLLGEKKSNLISDEIIQEHINQNPPTDANTYQTTIPNPMQLSLWWDETSKRYFYSNAEYIRRAELEATKQLQEDGYVGVNDVYELLGIEDVPLGEGQGWNKKMTNEVTITIGSALLGPDIPCGTITMEVHPKPEWLGL